jgi:hypothetical protein
VRLPIVEEDGTIANIVSPTMILKFLEQHLADLPENVTSRQVGKVPGVICKFFFCFIGSWDVFLRHSL